MNVIEELEKSLPDFERLLNENDLRRFAACDYESLRTCFPEIGEAVRRELLARDFTLYGGLRAMGFVGTEDMCDFIVKYLYAKKRADFSLEA